MCSVSIEPTTRDAILSRALCLFGERGIDATSLRQVAKAAGVSPALVVHHFGGKDGLVAAVDEASLYEFGAAYSSAEPAAGEDLLRRRARQTAQVMREHRDACVYLGRALVEGTPGSARLLRLMIDGGRSEIDALAEGGVLREDADRLWTTLQHFFLIWAPLSFMPLLEREVLGGSLLDETTLSRWVDANVELLEKGVYR
jgi:TetR/AcrR family transcriptional regulator, regulator of cefoperazone and chloramphenicol sensitivity